MPRFNSGSDVPSPLKELREERNLTLERVERLTQLSKQYIIKAEQCVYTEPSQVLLDFYEVGVGEVEAAYYAYQRSTRIANYGRLIEPWAFNSGRQHPFTQWRMLSGQISASGICKYYCIHPAILHKFEKEIMSEVPEVILKALLESGYKPETLSKLEEGYKRFKQTLREGIEVVTE